MKNILGRDAMRLAMTFMATAFVACNTSTESKKPGQFGSGGVDVGNMQSAFVPQTQASMSYPRNWKASEDGKTLNLDNENGSKIQAEKASLPDLSSPNALSLQKYLKAKYPDRDYQPIYINGLEGVRADLVNTRDTKRSDLYLISENKDFVHIEAKLNDNSNGVSEGERILLTTRVKYQGVAYSSSLRKTVTLKSRVQGQVDQHAYSFVGDCFTYSDCNSRSGVAIAYEGSFGIGTAGYDSGRIVELGAESKVAFDAVQVVGDYLESPGANIPLADIYTAFSPKTLQKDQDRLPLKVGHVYLIRTKSWPEEDVITKMRVESLDPNSLTITYQKMVYVEPTELKKQVDAMNDYTLKNEKPLNTGEVTLFNWIYWNSYFYASFNFEYSTSGNMYITRNGWDVRLEECQNSKLGLSASTTGSGLADIFDLGKTPIDQVSIAQMPDPNQFSDRSCREVQKDHTYLVAHYRYDLPNSFVLGALQVLDVDPKGQWARFKFRRIETRPADHFQKWISLAVPQGLQPVTLEASGNWLTQVFYPYINKRADQGQHYHERFDWSSTTQNPASYLRCDSRPFGPERGFFVLPKGTDINAVTVADLAALKGRYTHNLKVSKGDIIGAWLENYYDKTVFVMRVDDEVPTKNVKFSIRYLERAKAPYSIDPN